MAADTINSLEQGQGTQGQKRFLSFLFPKTITPIPTDEERINYRHYDASFFLKYTFWWVFPIMKVGYSRTLTDKDLYRLVDRLKVEHYIDTFNHLWLTELSYARTKHIANKCKARNETPATSSATEEEDLADFEATKYNMLFVIWATFKTDLIQIWILCIIAFVGYCASPLLSKELTNFVEEKALKGMPVNKGIGYAIGITLVLLLSGLCFNYALFIGLNLGIHSKALLTHVILEKSFKLNTESKHRFPASKITSMMTTDLSRIQLSLLYQPLLCSLPAALAFVIVILVLNIGVSAVIGIVIFLFFLVLIGASTTRLYALRERVSKLTDLRVGLVKDLINNIKVIKYYCWELPYFADIYDARTREISIIMQIQTIRNVVNAVAICLTGIISMIAFLILYALEHATKSAGAMFSSVTSFAVLSEVVYLIPECLSTGADMLMGFTRLVEYLFAPEINESDNYLVPLEKESKNALEINNSSFSWQTYEKIDDGNEQGLSKEEKKELQKKKKAQKKEDKKNKFKRPLFEKPVPAENSFPGLNNIDLSVKKGEFIVVTGQVGSGKSSLINAIAGFMKCDAGFVGLNGSLISCGDPWVQNATIRENILFGSEYEATLYNKVIYSCALQTDVNNLEAGDFTEVGEKGITLSGGQKARINLARAVYANKDIILMDDVLSAVDARVGRHIIEQCLLGILKKKTRILATHQLSLIDSADRIVYLNGDGSIDVGTMAELLLRNKGFANLMTFNKSDSQSDEIDVLDTKSVSSVEVSELSTSSATSLQKSTRTKQSKFVDVETEYKDVTENKDTSKGKIIEDEDRAVNAITADVYLQYVRAGVGKLTVPGFLLLVVFVMALSTFCGIFSNTWLSFWVSKKFPDRSNGFYIGIYVMLNLVWVVFVVSQFVLLVAMTTQSSKVLNLNSVKSVLYAPMSFIDVNPTGRVLNRFTKDTDALDNEIGEQVRMFAYAIAQMIGVLILMFIYLPWVALTVPPLFLVFFCVANYYQASSREVKRIEAVKRSIVYTNFDESLSGFLTIRSYNAEQIFIDNNKKYLNEMNEAGILYNVLQRWLGFQLELMADVVVLLVTLLCVNNVFHINAASVGLLLAYSTQLSGLLSLIIRTFSQLENDMNSVERICHYANNIPQEAPYTIESTQPNPSWPSQGEVRFSNVSMSYRPGLPLVLKNLDFTVKPQEKIGICGRTGAGKSSIMTALYRLSELDGGKIEIDGIDISTIGLRDLRSHLSIIPQDPVLFNNDLRKNLDPFGEHDDEILWSALIRTGMIDAAELAEVKIQKKDDGELHKFHLDQNVDNGGSNFSLGERQLISFARALVRDTKVLILDEATSLVDYETDSKIQKTIVKEFSHCTILCIAHRLKTILNYDRIMTLDKGETKEFDTPRNLFNIENGIFRQMCDKSNITEEDFVRKNLLQN